MQFREPSPKPTHAKPPKRCPDCAILLHEAFVACPGCGAALANSALKARADSAAEAGLGLPAVPASCPMSAASKR